MSITKRLGCVTGHAPLYSRKLHMRVRRARTSCDTSLTILALSLGDSVVNHLARRYVTGLVSTKIRHATTHRSRRTTLPWRDSRMRYLWPPVSNYTRGNRIRGKRRRALNSHDEASAHVTKPSRVQDVCMPGCWEGEEARIKSDEGV